MKHTRPSRAYSRDFSPTPQQSRRQIQIDAVPAALHRAITDKARREGVSLRSLLLTYLQEWSAR